MLHLKSVYRLATIDQRRDRFVHLYFQLCKRRALTQLLWHYDENINALCDRSYVDRIYLDCAKAFGKTVHSLLLSKQHNAGIQGNCVIGSSFFLNGELSVMLNGESSDPVEVLSGLSLEVLSGHPNQQDVIYPNQFNLHTSGAASLWSVNINGRNVWSTSLVQTCGTAYLCSTHSLTLTLSTPFDGNYDDI